MTIAKTGYLVSCFSYIFFLMLDWMRPGFVANFMSVHIFLLAAIIFGIFWGRESVSGRSQFPHFLISLFQFLLSILLAIFAWSEGRAFEDARILVALAAFAVPWIVGGLLKVNK